MEAVPIVSIVLGIGYVIVKTITDAIVKVRMARIELQRDYLERMINDLAEIKARLGNLETHHVEEDMPLA